MVKTVPLSEVCDFQGGSRPPKLTWSKTKQDGYVRMLQIRDFTQQRDSYVEYLKDSNTLKKCKTDDILIGRYGASIGKILTGLEGAYNVAIVKTIPDEKRLFKRFLYYILTGEKFQRFIQSIGSRAAQAGFNKADLNKFRIYLPSLEDQKRMVKILDVADTLRQKRKLAITLLDDYIKSVFLNLFGDLKINSKKLEVTEMGKIAEIEMGQSPIGSSYNNTGEGVPLLNGPTEFGEKNPIEKQWTTDPKKFCRQDDILFCVRGATAGRMNWADKQYCIGRGLCSIRPRNDKVSRSFLYIFLNQMYIVFQSTSNGSTFINIDKKRLNELPVPIDSSMSLEFEKKYLYAETLKQSMLTQSAEFDTQFQSLLQSSFRSEL